MLQNILLQVVSWQVHARSDVSSCCSTAVRTARKSVLPKIIVQMLSADAEGDGNCILLLTDEIVHRFLDLLGKSPHP